MCTKCEGTGFLDWIRGAWNTVSSGVTNAAKAVSNEFTNPNSVLRHGVTDAAKKVEHEFTDPNSVLRHGVTDAAQKVGHEFTDPNSILRGKVIPMAAKVVNTVTPFLQEIPIVGEVADALDAGLNVANKVNSAAKAVGYGVHTHRRHRHSRKHRAAGMDGQAMTGEAVSGAAVSGAAVTGAGRRRTRNGPVGLRTRVAPRHTSERNAVVRKVMAEHGLKMIAASKYVKEHGLWKPSRV